MPYPECNMDFFFTLFEFDLPSGSVCLINVISIRTFKTNKNAQFINIINTKICYQT